MRAFIPTSASSAEPANVTSQPISAREGSSEHSYSVLTLDHIHDRQPGYIGHFGLYRVARLGHNRAALEPNAHRQLTEGSNQGGATDHRVSD